MQKKKILVFAPILTLPDDIKKFLEMLRFLEANVVLDVWDPLEKLNPLENAQYYQHWQHVLAVRMDAYDAFIGFSFGAVILQQCFSLFSNTQRAKPVVLFSAPSFADDLLTTKLTRVLRLAEKKQLNEAHQLKMEYVLYPKRGEEINLPTEKIDLGCARLVEGIIRILTTDSRHVLQKSSVKYHHFIGADSYLVNHANVISGKRGELITVPHAGMRVLTDNPTYCYQKLEDIL